MAKSNTERLVRDLEAAVDDIAHDVRRTARHLSEEAEAQLRPALRKAADAGCRIATEARERGLAASQTAARQARAHPLATAAIVAAVVGFAATALSRRTRD